MAGTGRRGDGMRAAGSARPSSTRFTAAGDIVVGLDLLDGVDVTRSGRLREPRPRGSIAEHGRIDVLCNNAGIGAIGDVVASTPEDWERVFAVNVFGVANMSRARSCPRCGPRGRGAVVNTCSVVASVGLVDRAVYSRVEGRGARAHARRWRPTRSPTASASTACRRARSASPWVERTVAALARSRGRRSRRCAGGSRSVAWSSCDEVAAAVVLPRRRRARSPPAPTSCSTAASPACGSST